MCQLDSNPVPPPHGRRTAGTSRGIEREAARPAFPQSLFQLFDGPRCLLEWPPLKEALQLNGLRDLRVIELSTGIAGGYATKLFCDAGADVVKVEPPGGDPLRHFTASGRDLAGRDAPLFQFLAAGKRSVIGAPGDSHVEALVAGAHLVVESFDTDIFG